MQSTTGSGLPETDLDQPRALHPLVFLPDGEDVVVGRADIDEYVVLPADGAALVRHLADGLTPRQAADRYAEEFGETVDIADFLSTLAELGFLAAPGESTPPPAAPAPVRWQWLGRAVFSLPAWLCYAAVLAACVIEMVRVPELAPRNHHLFFTGYFTVIELTLFLGQFPLLLIHEGFHTLAGRRLGLRSRLGIGHRMMYLVLETSMDGLVAVPRRKRYLPILAGMVADVLVIAVLTLAADATRSPGGAFPLVGRLCLALAYATLLRLVWQFFLHLRTDLYVLATTLLGCVDLHTAARGTLRNATRRWTRRPAEDPELWHPTDRKVARWYAWLMAGGYTLTAVSFVLVVLPVGLTFVLGVLRRYNGHGSAAGLIDSTVLVVLNAAQLIAVGWLAHRNRRRASTAGAKPVSVG
ncbi:hypothetical protein [Streptomyces tateyamensis]|uniref:hypothetical protein n=1 Tax=Streptomyces tateyamensis TaxID=565073 RepID=UPI001C64FCD1|nr:hypothetical protein [Streptomyces tateyamensis]